MVGFVEIRRALLRGSTALAIGAGVIVLGGCADAAPFPAPALFGAPGHGDDATLYVFPNGTGYAFNAPSPADTTCSATVGESGSFTWVAGEPSVVEIAMGDRDFTLTANGTFGAQQWATAWFDPCPLNDVNQTVKFVTFVTSAASFPDGSDSPSFFGLPGSAPVAVVNPQAIWWDESIRESLPAACSPESPVWSGSTPLEAATWAGSAITADVTDGAGVLAEVSVNIRADAYELKLRCPGGGAVSFAEPW